MEVDQTPTESHWLDLATEIWIRILKKLEIRDLKNVHLVCKKFHEIAVNHVPVNLKLNFMFAGYLRNTPVPNRIYSEIEISDQFLREEHFSMIDDILVRTGYHVKKLKMFQGDQSFRKSKLVRFLSLVPNLNQLSLSVLDMEPEENLEEKIKLPKLKTLKFKACEPDFENFALNAIENQFVLSEVHISTETILKFQPLLKSHEKTIKKLTIGFDDEPHNLLEVLSSLTNLQLEYFAIYNTFNCVLETRDPRFLSFLVRQPGLKYLKLSNTILSDAVLQAICDNLKNLETLEIINLTWFMVDLVSPSGTENLSKLKKLKKLTMCIANLNFNHLNGLTVAVNENLEYLRANFANVPRMAMLQLPEFIPNLRILEITENFRHDFNVLRPFRNLERVEVKVYWHRHLHLSIFLPANIAEENFDNFTSNLKHLEVGRNGFPLAPENARKLASDFPYLEHLSVGRPAELTDQSVEIILKEFKHLKCLHIFRNEDTLSSETINIIKNFGQHLEQFHIWSVTCDLDFVKSELKDFGDQLRLVPHDPHVAVTVLNPHHLLKII